MPVRLGSKAEPSNEARIEIIPLIDIMFFLLAAFMLVSLSMVNLKRVNVDLPVASNTANDALNEPVSLSVDKSGVVYHEKKPVGAHELLTLLRARRAAGEKMRVMISGDRETRHGDMIRVLNIVREAGVYHAAFAVKEGDSGVIEK